MEVFSFFEENNEEVDPWYEARDYLFGWNGKGPNTATAYGIASSSVHPDAVWLCRVLATRREMDTLVDMFFDLYQQDVSDFRALFFSAAVPGSYILPHMTRLNRMRVAAQGGYLLAQAYYSQYHVGNVPPDWTANMIVSEDPYITEIAAYGGNMYRGPIDVNRNQWLLAAKRGNINVMVNIRASARKLDPFKHVMFFLHYRAADYYRTMVDGVTSAIRVIRKFLQKRKTKYGPSVYWIGRCLLDGNFDEKTLRFAGKGKFQGLTREKARYFAAAMDHYQVCVSTARAAVDTWVLVARRVGVVKDIRRLISNMLWGTRYVYATLLDDDEETRVQKKKQKRMV